jgi:hypothetical protein
MPGIPFKSQPMFKTDTEVFTSAKSAGRPDRMVTHFASYAFVFISTFSLPINGRADHELLITVAVAAGDKLRSAGVARELLKDGPQHCDGVQGLPPHGRCAGPGRLPGGFTHALSAFASSVAAFRSSCICLETSHNLASALQ